MFTKFKLLMVLVVVTLVSAVTIGLSTFYFGNAAKDERDIHNTVGETGDEEEEIKADNILENYDFGQKDLNENYTYIFFPSTLYNEFSADGIPEPENIFGYNEVKLDDFGDPVTIKGEVQYEVVTEESIGVTFINGEFTKGNSSTDNFYSNYYDLLKNSLNNLSEYYLYDLSSGDYPISASEDDDSNHYITRDGIRYFNINKFNDPYSLNNKGAFAFFKDFTSYKKDYDSLIDNSFSGSDYWVDSGRDYYGPLGIVHYYDYYYYNDTDPKDPGNYDDRPLSFSKAQEILTPLYNDNTYNIKYDNQTVTYDFGLKLTADYDERKKSGEIDAYISNFRGDEGLSPDDNGNPDWDGEQNYDEQLQKRRQYRNDRFGFWTEFYDWSASSNNPNYDPDNDLYIEGTGSRYLPIKITTNGNLTPDTLAEILPDLSASMYSKDVYSDYTANVWTYNTVDSSGNLKGDYTTATGGFTSKDIANVFDIMQNPSNYADEDNVIRLYPVYSNGKVPNEPRPAIEEGGRDALRAKFEYSETNDSLTSKLITHKKLVYSKESDEFNGIEINYAILKNIYLEPGLYTSITFDGDYAYGSGEWRGRWHSMFRADNSQITNFLNTYGEGLYTFYLVIGNSAGIGDTNVTLENVQSYITSDQSKCVSLNQKSLIPWDFYTVKDDKIEDSTGYTTGYTSYLQDHDDMDRNNRPVALFIEKVTNLRLVTDIPIKESEEGTPSKDQDWKGIDSSVQAGLLSAKNFLLADGVKTYNKVDGSEGQIDQTSVTDVTSPYVYFIQNADFRYVNNLYFQIRFSNQYIPNALRIVTDFNEYLDENDPLNQEESNISNKSPNNYVSYTIGGETFELASQRALLGDGEDLYIQNVSASSSDGTKREGFKLKDYYARGVYDIMLVANGSYSEGEGDDERSIRVYNMYINRHTNSFIKVFDKNPGTFNYTGGGISGTFVKHKVQGDGETLADGESYTDATKIWQGRGYLGEMFTSSSVFEDTSNSLLTSLQSYFNEAQTTKYTLYKLVDAVTNRAVAYYDTTSGGTLFNSQGSTKNGSIDLFMILKNYVLYLEPVTTSS